MPEPKTAGLSAPDISEIRRASDEYGKLMLARDFDALARLYAEDAVLMPPGRPPVHGRQAIEQFLREFPRVTGFRLEIEHIEGRVDLAYVRGACVMAMQSQGAQGTDEGELKYIEIHKRLPDGSWPIVADIFNANK